MAGSPSVHDVPSGNCAEKYLEVELEKLKQENQELVAELEDLKVKDVSTVIADNEAVFNSTAQERTP